MPRPTCQHPDCPNSALSIGQLCGDHENWKNVEEILRNLKEEEYENLYLKDVELSEVT